MNNDKQKLDGLVEKLIAQGEGVEELHYFQSIFEDLTDEEKDKLIKNLEDELESLEKAI